MRSSSGISALRVTNLGQRASAQRFDAAIDEGEHRLANSKLSSKSSR